VKFTPITRAAFFLGIAAALVEFSYLFGWVDAFRADFGIHLSMVLGALWVVTTLIALGRHGLKALWTLIVAPFALVGPAFFFLIIVACYVFGDCP